MQIEEAAFILKIPTKIASANHIAFIQAIFGRAAIGSSKHVRTRRSASLRGEPRSDRWKHGGRVSAEAVTRNKRSRWKSNEEQRNVASPWQAKGKQLIKICAQRFCDSFGSRNIGRWIKSKSPMRLVMAQRDGTTCAASSAISNRQAKSRVLERIDMSCPTRPILSLER